MQHMTNKTTSSTARAKTFLLTTSFIFMLSAPLAISACTPIGIATGAGAATGVAAASEGGISGSINDTRINAEISDLWFKYDLKTFTKLNITVDRGRVLLTGVVDDPKHRVEAVRLAWQAEGVKQVINEINIAESKGFTGYVKDTWITTQLRSKMTFNRNIQSINYSIDTVQGIVYIMGVAQNSDELDHVKNIARSIKNVSQVVTYVQILTPQDPTLTPSITTNSTSTGDQP